MDLRISSPAYGPIEFKPSRLDDDDFVQYLVPYSDTNTAKGKFGKILFQKVDFSPSSILYNVYKLRHKLTLNYTQKDPMLVLHLLLKNNIDYRIKGINDIRFNQGRCNILFIPEVEFSLSFEKNDYLTFNIFFPVELLEPYAGLFPFLEDFLGNVRQHKAATLFAESGEITSEMYTIINSLIYIPFEEAKRKKYFEIKINELFFLLLIQYHQNEAEPNIWSNRVSEAVFYARNIIKEHFDQHFTIGQIAKKAGINESKLKSAFKQSFGTGITTYMLEVKMQKARSLILETIKPIKEIASIIGYTSEQNFVTAFKKFYTCTPGSLRKNA